MFNSFEEFIIFLISFSACLTSSKNALDETRNAPLPQNYHLFECVGCYNTHLVGFGKLVRGFLNKHIGGFCLFGIYNADIIHGFNLSVFALYLVRTNTRIRLHLL